jgi:GT2 family glycosyltransferase
MFIDLPSPEKSQGGLAFILPIYGSFDYSRRAAASFFVRTPAELNPILITLDDASPEYDQQDWNAWYEGLPRDRCYHYHYPENGGLTRSWNRGLDVAKELGCRYAVAGNSDVLFTPHWHEGLKYVLDNNIASLVGPVTNAPGRTERNRQHQNVRNFFPDYEISDDADKLLAVSQYLKETYSPPGIVPRDVNGFFMMATVDAWFSGAFDRHHVFDPKHKMVGNEDELVKRWRRLRRSIGFVPASYIFHYRSVSRVVKGIDVGRHRLQDANKKF